VQVAPGGTTRLPLIVPLVRGVVQFVSARAARHGREHNAETRERRDGEMFHVVLLSIALQALSVGPQDERGACSAAPSVSLALDCA
jgi:hypothetical protein